MAVNDPIADFLTRIRNAHMAKHDSVEMPHSKMKVEMARILKEEGYVNDYSESGRGRGEEARRRAQVRSRRAARDHGPAADEPARTPCVPQAGEHPRVLDGLGVAILSTSRGILTDHEASRAGIGGEVLCFVY